MHDATEGGVLGGLYEVAEASGVGLRINQSAIPIRPEVAAVCAAAGIDPYVSISEGTLVATVRPQHAEGLLAALARANISAADVGEVLPASAARTMLDADGREVPLTPPRLDPYWEVFARWSAQ
jgi:hydrogenase maturation factor